MLRVERTWRGTTEVLWFDGREVSIGRIAGPNELVLAQPRVSKRHARMVVKDGKVILVDLKSTNGTWLNGRRITSPNVIRAHDEIVIADIALRARPSADEPDPTLELDVVEQRLLARVADRDPGSREVYADWLEEHGESLRAEYLRLQDAIAELPPVTSRDHPTKRRVYELSLRLEPRWRRLVARPPIERCAGDGAPCPGDWGALERGPWWRVRTCGICAHEVQFCRDLYDARPPIARAPVARGAIVVEPSTPRSPGDLDPASRLGGAWLAAGDVEPTES